VVTWTFLSCLFYNLIFAGVHLWLLASKSTYENQISPSILIAEYLSTGTVLYLCFLPCLCISLILVFSRWWWTRHWFVLDCGVYASFTSKNDLYQLSDSCCKESFLFQGSCNNILKYIYSALQSICSFLISLMFFISFSQTAWKNLIRDTQP
jgi:hypothetical protein